MTFTPQRFPLSLKSMVAFFYRTTAITDGCPGCDSCRATNAPKQEA
jgi:hypothetical protein